MNQISKELSTGTIGELLVQVRLLQYGVQAAAPIKDSGNDLIAIKGECFRAIQVKTRTSEPFTIGNLPALFHLVAVVQLVGENNEVYLDASRVFLVPRDFVERNSIRYFETIRAFEICPSLISDLFH